MTDFLSPKDEFVFTGIFSDIGNADIITAFLRTVLDIPVDRLKRLQTLSPLAQEDPTVIEVEFDTGHIVDFEMQRRPPRDLQRHVHYYKASMIERQFPEGISGIYAPEIKPTSFAAFLDYSLYEDQRCRHVFEFRDRSHDCKLPGYGEIHTIELPKQEFETCPEAQDWLRFLSARNTADLELLAEKGGVFRKAVDALHALDIAYANMTPF